MKFCIYLCTFSTRIFSVTGESDDSETQATVTATATVPAIDTAAINTEKDGVSAGDTSLESEWSTATENSDATGAKTTGAAGDVTGAKTVDSASSLRNVFKKPFINKDLPREGWVEEKLLVKLMGISSDEMGDPALEYKPTIRSMGFPH